MISIKICVRNARHLKSVETFSTQDPFCILYVYPSKSFTTKTHVDGGAHATWQETCIFDVVNPETDVLTFKVMNDNTFGSHTLIGEGKHSVSAISKYPVNTDITEWFHLTNSKGKPAGEVELTIKWQMIIGLHVKAIGAKSLKSVELLSKQDPYLVLFLDPKDKRKTRVHEDGGKKATWGNSFEFKSISDPSCGVLTLEVFNSNTISDDLIGSTTINVPRLQCQAVDTAVDAWHEISDADGKKAGEVQLEVAWHLSSLGEQAKREWEEYEAAKRQADIDAAVAVKEAEILAAVQAERDAEEARVRAEAEAQALREAEEARVRAEAQARALREAEEARVRAEAEARALREAEEARVRAEAEARALREAEEARVRAEAEARALREAEEARVRAEAEAQAAIAAVHVNDVHADVDSGSDDDSSDDGQPQGHPDKKKKKKKAGLGGALKRLGRALR
jgi:hypothetical protein